MKKVHLDFIRFFGGVDLEAVNQKNFQELHEALEQKSSTLGSLEVLCEIPKINYASFILLKHLGMKKSPPFIRTTYPAGWVSHYLQNNYLNFDPILERARNSDSSFFWSEVSYDENNAQILDFLDKYGIDSIGYVYCFRDNKGNHSVLSLNGFGSSDEWKQFVHLNKSELLAVLHKIHATALSEQQNSNINRYMKLARREVEVLYWTSEGKSHYEISRILNVSENTVHGYVKSARLKLDSVSVAQAVSRATKLGLI